MLTSQQKVFRRFWYATHRLNDLADGPKPFTLLGEPIVVFLDEAGEPAALADRCCHRTAKLSKGWTDKGAIVCGYHGWTFDRSGMLVRIPQFGDNQPLPKVGVRAHHCAARYGYAWVCLDEPLQPIPVMPEEGMPGFRRIHQFHEIWKAAPLRLMENSFDTAHFSFVHKGTFGQIDRPKPEKYEINETEWGFVGEVIAAVTNPPSALRITGVTESTTRRHMRSAWHMPFCRKLDIEYPSGIRHIIFNSATPIDDGSMLVAQILFRNDTEADCSTKELIDWDAAILKEDREMLEATDPDAPLVVTKRAEAHMPSDRPGIIMRKHLFRLLQQHGETEVTHAKPSVTYGDAPQMTEA